MDALAFDIEDLEAPLRCIGTLRRALGNRCMLEAS